MICRRCQNVVSSDDFVTTFGSSGICRDCVGTMPEPVTIKKIGNLTFFKPEDVLPKKPNKKRYEHVPCVVLYSGQWHLLNWNCEHLVWDDQDGDDYYCDAMQVEWWAQLPDAREFDEFMEHKGVKL